MTSRKTDSACFVSLGSYITQRISSGSFSDSLCMILCVYVSEGNLFLRCHKAVITQARVVKKSSFVCAPRIAATSDP